MKERGGEGEGVRERGRKGKDNTKVTGERME